MVLFFYTKIGGSGGGDNKKEDTKVQKTQVYKTDTSKTQPLKGLAAVVSGRVFPLPCGLADISIKNFLKISSPL